MLFLAGNTVFWMTFAHCLVAALSSLPHMPRNSFSFDEFLRSFTTFYRQASRPRRQACHMLSLWLTILLTPENRQFLACRYHIFGATIPSSSLPQPPPPNWHVRRPSFAFVRLSSPTGPLLMSALQARSSVSVFAVCASCYGVIPCQAGSRPRHPGRKVKLSWTPLLLRLWTRCCIGISPDALIMPAGGRVPGVGLLWDIADLVPSCPTGTADISSFDQRRLQTPKSFFSHSASSSSGSMVSGRWRIWGALLLACASSGRPI